MIKQLIKKNRFCVKICEYFFDTIYNPMRYKILKKIKLTKLKFQPAHHSFGEKNNDIQFAILKKEAGKLGPLAYVFSAVYPFLLSCEENNCIPLIDVTEDPCTVFRNDNSSGNAWEFYFEQPSMHYSLQEAYMSKNVYIDNGYNFSKNIPNGYNLTLPIKDEERREYMGHLFRKNIGLQKRLLSRIDILEKELFRERKVLGVSIRSEFNFGEKSGETLYTRHPKVADCCEYIKMIKEYMRKWHYDYFFLACDGREWSDQIKEHFGEKCIRMDRPLYHWAEGKENEKCEFANGDVERCSEDYIIETFLLTRCDSLYATNCSQSRFAYVLACDVFRNICFDDRGRI